MPTPAEQKALTFLALVVLLGGAVRVVRGGVPSGATPTLAEQQALARQAFAASSVATPKPGQHAPASGNPRRKARKSRYGGAKSDFAGALAGSADGQASSLSPAGFPPPSPRIDIGSPPLRRPPEEPGRAAPVDLDLADTAQIGRLPGVGPALARRIVASRDSLGPFGALAGLRRVKGVGPVTLKRLAGLVTFSGQARR